MHGTRKLRQLERLVRWRMNLMVRFPSAQFELRSRRNAFQKLQLGFNSFQSLMRPKNLNRALAVSTIATKITALYSDLFHSGKPPLSLLHKKKDITSTIPVIKKTGSICEVTRKRVIRSFISIINELRLNCEHRVAGHI